MRGLVKIGVVLLLMGTLTVACAVQVGPARKPSPARPSLATPKSGVVVKPAMPNGTPDLAVWAMQAALEYTEVGQDTTWKPRDRVKLEYTFKNIGLGPFPEGAAKVSVFRNGVHQDTWTLPKLGLGEAKSYSDHLEFNHGEKTTFTITITPIGTPVEDTRGLANNRRELVIGEGEDTILHAHGLAYGVFTWPQ